MNDAENKSIALSLRTWKAQVERATGLLNTIGDAGLAAAIAPGRNTGIYLLGHLTAHHDAMLPLLGLGTKLYPELEAVFIKSPDGAGLVQPGLEALKQYWQEVNATLLEKMEALSAEQWFTRHSHVSEEDFVKEPHRNKLSILLSRTSHMAYHMGQLILLKN